MIFRFFHPILSPLLLAIGIVAGFLLGRILARLAPDELLPAQRWLTAGKKVTYLLIMAISIGFLARTPLVAAVAFFGLACGYFKKIFFTRWLYLFFGFLFLMSIRNAAFSLALSVSLFLHLLIDGIRPHKPKVKNS